MTKAIAKSRGGDQGRLGKVGIGISHARKGGEGIQVEQIG